MSVFDEPKVNCHAHALDPVRLPHGESIEYRRFGQPIEIAINASPTGMNPNAPLTFPVDRLGDALIVADAVTKPAVARWFAEARKLGLKTQAGEEMTPAKVSIQLRYPRLRPVRSEDEKDKQVRRGAAAVRGAVR